MNIIATFIYMKKKIIIIILVVLFVVVVFIVVVSVIFEFVLVVFVVLVFIVVVFVNQVIQCLTRSLYSSPVKILCSKRPVL